MLTPNQVQWVEALESGDYSQRRRALTRLDRAGNVAGHCCLGVACEVAIQNGVNLKVEDAALHDQRSYDGASIALPERVVEWPERVVEWLGVGRVDPLIGGDHASALNDCDEMTFAEIASAIRENGVR